MEDIINEIRNKNIISGLPNTYSHLIFDAIKPHLDTLLEQGKVLVFLTDKNLNIKFISHIFCDTLHYDESMVGESLFSIVWSESHESLKEAMKKANHTQNYLVPIFDLMLRCAMGKRHYFDGFMINQTSNKNLNGYVFYLHNVTSRKKSEDKLKELNLELDSFVYKASHDLRAPLASLAGLVNVTENEFPSESNELFKMMRNSIHRLDKFVTQLAHYSRNTNLDLMPQKIDFEELVKEVIANYSHYANAEKVSFYISAKGNQEITSDTFRLKIILNNLISNAIKYHNYFQKKPSVFVEVLAKDAFFYITIKDNGKGIGEEYIAKIFDMFVRASIDSDGSGLGLYIVKKALEKLHGKIKVKSKIGSGTIFKLKIPQANQKTNELKNK
jgi:PAS domain S-box-containing protein